MINKVAILIDGGFFMQRFRNLYNKFPRIDDMQPFLDKVLQQLQNLNKDSQTDILFRAFYYDCRPYGGKVKDPEGNIKDFSATMGFRHATNFQNDLRTFPQMALRLGEISFDGWKWQQTGSYLPDFKQKSVDMKIGLDIAWLASKKIVDKIVLVAGDSDFIAPMKFARREGLLVYLFPMQQEKIKLQLKEHADFIIP